MKDTVAPIWLRVVAFIIPLIGFIYYFVAKGDYPEKAKTVGKVALWGFGIAFLFNMMTMNASAQDMADNRQMPTKITSEISVYENPFEGFEYGMHRDEAFKIVDEKVKQGIFKTEIDSKRWLLMPKYRFYSKTLNRKVILQTRLRFVKKKLSDIEVTIYTGGSIALGGFNKGKANALTREVKSRFNDIGVDMDWELNKINHGYYRLYIPTATVNL